MLAMDQGVVEEWLSEFKVKLHFLYESVCLGREKILKKPFTCDLYAVHTLLLIIDRIYFTHKQTHFEVLRYQKKARSYSNMSICC